MSALLTPMASPPATAPFPRKTLAELLHELGDIPADRVRLYPQPGTATEADAVFAAKNGALCELVNGTLVEKPMGFPESFLGGVILTYINIYLFVQKSGMAAGADGLYRMIHGNLREPDVSFTRKDRLPSPLPQVGGWCPDLCVEVISPSNTRAELAMKRKEYFAAGCRLLWEVDPRTRNVTVYTDATSFVELDESGTLDGRDVLPGFTLPLSDVFSKFEDLGPSTSP